MRLLKKLVCLCLALIMLSSIGCSSASSKNQLPESMPKDFSFVFNYGVNAKNQLDTAKDSFTKDMISEPSITTNLKLTEEELNTIYLEMRKINILNYPEAFKPKRNMIQKPFETYSIKIVDDGVEKSITWKDENASETRDAVQLRKVFNKIKEIIANKEEYKKLPEPKGGYL